jgi:CRISPR-associated protein Csm3
MKLFKKIFIRGELTILTGLHIGSSKDSSDIGGIDSPVVRRKDNNQPYIPGSSLKGKLRCLLDVAYNEIDTTNKPHHPISKLMGARGDNNQSIPSRLIVRDANMCRESAKFFYELREFTDLPFTEIKFENTIDRLSGVARHPRQFERVPAGAKFDVEFVINIFGRDAMDAKTNEQDHLKLLKSGIKLLEDDYLGGSGSRGYGQVKFDLSEPVYKNIESYLHAES